MTDNNNNKFMSEAYANAVSDGPNETALSNYPKIPKMFHVRDALSEVIEEIGQLPIIKDSESLRTGWWEIFSHLVAKSFHDGPISEVNTIEDFVKKETDYLDLDDKGPETPFGRDGLSTQKKDIEPDQLKSLALRVIVFMRLRGKLHEAGFSFPFNQDIYKALHRVRSELAKDSNDRDNFERSIDIAPKTVPKKLLAPAP